MIISPFNFGFFFLIGIGAAIVVLASLLLRRAGERAKTIFICALSVFNLILYFVYKVGLMYDTEYIEIIGKPTSPLYDILPLQLCNINLFLIPIGVLMKSKPIKGFSAFVAPLAALMPFIFPEPEFVGFPITSPRIFGYYVTHLLIIVAGVCLFTLGFYKPEIKSLPGIFATMGIFGVSIHIVNTIIRHTFYSRSNYFFTYETNGVSALDAFWNLIPIPFVYLFPAIIILGVYMLAFCFIYNTANKLGKKK